MEKQATPVLEEIRQLIEQYRREVPGGRRAWPESIKTRIGQLCVLGMSAKEISEQTELSYYTILGWVPESYRRRYRSRRPQAAGSDGHFAPVAIRGRPSVAMVTLAKGSNCPAPEVTSNATVTVTLPDGIRIEGVTPEFLRLWLGRGGGT